MAWIKKLFAVNVYSIDTLYQMNWAGSWYSLIHGFTWNILCIYVFRCTIHVSLNNAILAKYRIFYIVSNFNGESTLSYRESMPNNCEIHWEIGILFTSDIFTVYSIFRFIHTNFLMKRNCNSSTYLKINFRQIQVI